MNEREKEIAYKMAEAIRVLPPNKVERWLGYAEGVMDMAAKNQEENKIQNAPCIIAGPEKG